MKLTTNEAVQLIGMLKRVVKGATLSFPCTRGGISFDVIGERKIDEFTVNIDRKGINHLGCTYQGRIKANNIILMRLDMNPSGIHTNPDGSRILGSHLHIYTEEFEMRYAVPFDIAEQNLFDTCYIFFERFNIIEPPEIVYQETIG